MEFDTEKFISAIRDRQSIWNLKCSDYSDKNKKRRDWEEVVNIYGAGLSIEEKKKLGINLQKKWRNIRDCFVKAYKAKETKSGSATKKKYSYVFYDNLLFLKDTVFINSTSSNITIKLEINDEDEIKDVQHTTVHSSDSPCASKRTKRNENDDIGKELIGTLNKNIETQNSEDDGDRFFFLSLVKDFKKIPEHLRMQTKMNILKVIQDAQMFDNPNSCD